MWNRGKSKCVDWLRRHAAYEGDDCLAWPFSKTRGYGNFRVYGQSNYAHRYMCELVHGPAPEGKDQVAHSCGKGHEGCVNPKHLRWTTISENLSERATHGTQISSRYGRHGKLTEENIEQIRLLDATKTKYEIARMFGISTSTVRYWLKPDRPKWIERPGTSRSAEYRRRKKQDVTYG